MWRMKHVQVPQIYWDGHKWCQGAQAQWISELFAHERIVLRISYRILLVWCWVYIKLTHIWWWCWNAVRGVWYIQNPHYTCCLYIGTGRRFFNITMLKHVELAGPWVGVPTNNTRRESGLWPKLWPVPIDLPCLYISLYAYVFHVLDCTLFSNIICPFF